MEKPDKYKWSGKVCTLIRIPHAKSPGKQGSWWWMRDTLVFSCPKCGNSSSLNDYDVSSEGEVTPSLLCSLSTCDFHELLKLEDF